MNLNPDPYSLNATRAIADGRRARGFRTCPATIDVHHVDLDGTEPGSDRSLLGPDETRRADRFVRDLDRRRWTAARAALRRLLGAYVGEHPKSLRFIAAENGKPRLADMTEVHFNLSHSGNHVVLAMTRGFELGIDVELHRPLVDLESLVQRFFAPEERERVLDGDDDHRRETFFRCWTRKEAYLKARGTGITRALDGFAVSVDDANEARLLVDRTDPDAPSTFRIVPFDVSENAPAALVHPCSDVTIRLLVGGSMRILITQQQDPH